MALVEEDPADSVFHQVVPCHSAWAVYHQTAWEVVWVGDRHLGVLDDQAEAVEHKIIRVNKVAASIEWFSIEHIAKQNKTNYFTFVLNPFTTKGDL